MSPAKAKRRIYRLLSRGSRYFKTDLFYLTKGSFWLSLGRGVGILSGIILSVGFANLLPLEVYGNYRFVLSLAGIISALTLTGMGVAITRAVAQGLEGILHTAFWTHLKWSVGITAAAFAGAFYYYVNDNITLTASLLIIGSLSPFLESARLYNSYLIGKKDFRKSTMLGVIRKIIPTTVMLLTLYLTNNIIIIVFAYFASNTFTMLWIYYSAQKLIPLSTKSDKTTINYSKHLSLMNVINRIAGNIDKILIFHFLGAAPLALYSFALLPVRQLQSISKIIQTLSLPKLSNRPLVELKKSLPKKAALLFLFVLSITVVYILAAPFIFKILFPQYLGSVIFTQVIALMLLFAPNALYQQTLVAHMKKKQLYIFNSASSITRIVLFLILLPIYGIWGAIATILISKVVVTIAAHILVKYA